MNGVHVIDWEGAKVVEIEDRFWHRKYKEHIFIRGNSTNLMNLDTGYQISGFWDTALASHFFRH